MKAEREAYEGTVECAGVPPLEIGPVTLQLKDGRLVTGTVKQVRIKGSQRFQLQVEFEKAALDKVL